MKKLGILMMPLMAVSLLANCGGSKSIDPSKIDLYKKEIMYDTTGKNITEVDEYEYNRKGLCTKYTKTYPSDPDTKYVYEYSYDKHENEIGSHTVTYNGDDLTDVGWTVTEYTYDEQNRVTKYITKMSFDNVEWFDFEHYEYEYSENITIKKDFNTNDGSLDSTTIYTYDAKGNLVNEKKFSQGENESKDYEKVYTVDENGCATTIVEFSLDSSGERSEMLSIAAITYLKNLWYRPLKETITYCGSKESTTTKREYDSKNRLKLYKIYSGTEEGPTPSYGYYATYEY